MKNWDEFRYFLAVSRLGTLKKAAAELGVNQTTVGRNLLALEERLRVQLLEKRSDGYFPTTAGRRALEIIGQLDSTIIDLERIIAGTDDREEGSIRVAMPGALANHWLIPSLPSFTKRYPKIKWEFLTGGEVVNLARREADFAVRLVRPDQHDLIARKIGNLTLAVFGHHDLLENKPPLKNSEDLQAYPFVGLYPNITSLSERAFLKRLKSDSNTYIARSAAWSSVFYSVCSGVGLGILPVFMGNSRADLKRLTIFGEEHSAIWLVLHPDIQNNKRVRLAIDHITKLARTSLK